MRLLQHVETEVVAVADIRPTNRDRAIHGDNNEHRVGLIKKLGAEAASKVKVYKDQAARTVYITCEYPKEHARQELAKINPERIGLEGFRAIEKMRAEATANVA